MKILVDAHSFYSFKNTGYERFSKAVLPALVSQVDCDFFSCGKNRLARSLNFLPLFFPKKRFDRILFPTNPPLAWAKDKLKKTVFIVHDIFPLKRPDMCQSTTSLIYGRFLEEVLKSGLVLSVSKFTSKEISEYFHIDPVPVIGCYVEKKLDSYFDRNLSIEIKERYDNFFLAVGTVEPRKNYSYLLKEYSKYRSKESNPFNLLILGRRGWEDERVIELLGTSEGVYWLQDGSDALVWTAYREARALLSASHYEGFNMPAFECAAVGTPVVVPDGSAPTLEEDHFLTYSLNEGNLEKMLHGFSNFSFGRKLEINFSKYTAESIAKNIVFNLESSFKNGH